MGIWSFLGNIASGIQGSRMGKKQMQLGQQMISEARSLSEAYQRPEMRTPQAYRMMVDMAKGRQFKDLPGMTTMQNQIDKAIAAGMSAISRRGVGAEGMGAAVDLYTAQMGEQAGLGIQKAQFRDQAELDYMAALEGLGDWQQQAWQWNEADPYLQAQLKAAQLEQMGRMGEWEGLKNKMGSWAETFQGMGGALDDTMSQIASAFLPESKIGNWMTALGGQA